MAKQNQKPKLPEKGERTKTQTYVADVAGVISSFAGYGQAAIGTYKTYRTMRANPTIALARSVATAPIRTAMWSVVTADEVPEDIKVLVEKQIGSVWSQLIKNVLYALDYGWSPFEKVWNINDEGKLIYEKLKPLLVDVSVPLVDKKTGVFEGIRNMDVDLPPVKCFVFTYDGEAGNIFGRSRHENIRRTAWHHWQEISERRGKYAKKTAGIIPIVEYPEGEGQDETGSTKSNWELAKKVLSNLGMGNGVAMPNTMAAFAGDLARSGIDITQLKAWHIEFLESKGAHARGFTDMLRHLESLMMRGWLIPERAATEGQYGTKAESETQAELALVIADLVFLDILEEVSKQIVNPLVTYNFGQHYKDSVWLERGSIDPIQRIFFKEIIKAVLGEKSNIDLFLQWIDVNSLLDTVGLPKATEKIPTEENISKKKEQTDDEKNREDIEEQSRSPGRMEKWVRKIFSKAK